jgi:hypothetical protein
VGRGGRHTQPAPVGHARGGRRKKTIEVVGWLANFYTSDDSTGDLPIEPFAGIPVEHLEAAQELLQVLEACEWAWDINTILDQPKPLLDAVVALKATGMRLKRQAENKKQGKF